MPDCVGPAAGDATPVRVLLPMPAGAEPSTGSGLRYGWRILLLPPPQASAGGLEGSLKLLDAEMEESYMRGDRPEVSETTHVMLVLPTSVRATAGCGSPAQTDDWGRETREAEPDDPDPLCRFLDKSGIAVKVHAGASTPQPRHLVLDTPSAAGPRPGYCLLTLNNYHSGCYSSVNHHVNL
jgi:hypothetical protein